MWAQRCCATWMRRGAVCAGRGLRGGWRGGRGGVAAGAARLGCLREAGFSLEMADRAWNAIDSHIYGFTLQELNFPFETEEYSEAAKNGLSLIPADKYPYLNRLTHDVIEGRYDGIHDFEFGLELILSGLDRFRHNA